MSPSKRFIRTRILAARTHQLYLGASPFVLKERTATDLEVAKAEMQLDRCPIRPLEDE